MEETYRVLNGAYQIITGAQTDTQQQPAPPMEHVAPAHPAPLAPAQLSEEHPNNIKLPRSRPTSKMSRPSSRRSIKRGEDGNEEEEWGEEEEGEWEWEYYYEEENGEKEGTEPVTTKDEQPNIDPIKK